MIYKEVKVILSTEDYHLKLKECEEKNKKIKKELKDIQSRIDEIYDLEQPLYNGGNIMKKLENKKEELINELKKLHHK